MKKVTFLFCLFIMLSFHNLKKVSASTINFEEEEITTKETITDYKFCNNTFWIETIGNKNLLKSTSKEIELKEGRVQVIKEHKELLYIIVNTNNDSFIISYNTLTGILKENKFDNKTIKDLLFSDDIYITGRTSVSDDNVNGFVMSLDYQLNEINYVEVGGTGNESIEKMKIKGHLIYCAGIKDAISFDSNLNNVGDNKTLKSFLIVFNEQLEEENTIYFDEKEQTEVVEDFELFDDGIVLAIRAEKNVYIYKIGYNYEMIEHYKLFFKSNSVKIYNSLHPNLDYVFLSEYQNHLTLYSKQEVLYNFETSGIIIDEIIKDGILYVSVLNHDKIKVITLKDYEILKNDVYTVNRLNYNLDENESIQVVSIFEKLVPNLISIDPSYDKRIHGNYNLHYRIERLAGDIIELNSKLEVKEFTNFIDGGIYKIGKTLEFFGIGSIDGRKIIYGEELDQPGEYTINIEDANNNSKEYHIRVVEDYYLDNSRNDEQHLPIDQIVEYGEKPVLTYMLDENVSLKEVYINGESYTNFKVKDGIATIIFPELKETNISYRINKFICEKNKKEYTLLCGDLINFKAKITPIKVNTKKEISENDVALNYNIIDSDKTFRYLIIQIKENDNIILNRKEISSFHYENKQSDKITVKVVMATVSSMGEILETPLLEYELKEEKLSLDIFLSYKQNTLNDININLTLPKDKKNIQKMDLGKTSILSLIQTDSLAFLQKMHLVSFGIFAFGIFVLIISKIKNKIRKKEESF